MVKTEVEAVLPLFLSVSLVKVAFFFLLRGESAFTNIARESSSGDCLTNARRSTPIFGTAVLLKSCDVQKRGKMSGIGATDLCTAQLEQLHECKFLRPGQIWGVLRFPIGHDINSWGILRGQGERLNHFNKDLRLRFAGITRILGEMCI